MGLTPPRPLLFQVPDKHCSLTAGTCIDGQQHLQLKREASNTTEESKCFVGVALLARSNLKGPLSYNPDKTGKEYLSRHTLDGKLLYVDTRLVYPIFLLYVECFITSFKLNDKTLRMFNESLQLSDDVSKKGAP